MLSDAKIRGVKPRDKAFKLTDSHRLYLLVKPGGSKLWKWNYAYDGKQKTTAFGSYPVVTLAEARVKRDEGRGMLLEGKDPAIQKKLRIEANLEKARNTFELVAREWYEIVKAQWARVHAEDVLRSLERDAFPFIGDLPVSELTPPKILEVLQAIEERGAIESARRLRQRISSVFVFAIAKGIAEKDPAEKLAAVLKPLRKGRQPAITDLKALKKMIGEAEQDYARLVDEWVTGIGLPGEDYGTHSLRRTKASIIYKATGNLRAVQILLGHTKIESTVRYLGVDVEDALTLAEGTEI